MRKRLNIKSVQDNLAKEMWGDIKIKENLLDGMVLYICSDYKGLIFNDKGFKLNKKLKNKLDPMTIIDIYTFRKERFIINRTDVNEQVPEKLKKKYINNRYDERINIYALAEDSMKIVYYYHRDVLRSIYSKKLNKECSRYKSETGYIQKQIRESMRYLCLNAPEFIKKKDKNKAKNYLDKIMEKEIKIINNKEEKTSQIKIENIRDKFIQRKELL